MPTVRVVTNVGPVHLEGVTFSQLRSVSDSERLLHGWIGDFVQRQLLNGVLARYMLANEFRTPARRLLFAGRQSSLPSLMSEMGVNIILIFVLLRTVRLAGGRSESQGRDAGGRPRRRCVRCVRGRAPRLPPAGLRPRGRPDDHRRRGSGSRLSPHAKHYWTSIQSGWWKKWAQSRILARACVF